jgi:hypothetical protein
MSKADQAELLNPRDQNNSCRRLLVLEEELKPFLSK